MTSVAEKKNWVVRMKCVVTKDVVLKNCTEREAWDNTFDFAEDEREVEQHDFVVQSVKEDK